MSDFNLDIEGIPKLKARLEKLKEENTTDAIYATGTDTEWGVYLEMGTRNMQPYPWFRPAIREFQANPESFITDNTGYTRIDDIPNARAMVEAVATALNTKMEKNVNAAGATDRSPGTHPEHPKVDTGTLRQSIQVQRVK